MLEPFRYEERQGVPVLLVSAWSEESASLTAGISARHHYSLHRQQDQVQDVVPNRERLADSLGFSLAAWTCAEQVHDKHIVRVTRAERGAGSRTHQSALPAADGLVTDEEDVLLTAFFADCVPLIFWCPESGAIGLAHAGWRGTAAGIAQAMVDRMQREFTTEPESLRVAIGPSIGACCYEVDDRVMTALRCLVPAPSDRTIQPKPNGRYMLDLKHANLEILRNSGIVDRHVWMTHYCTSCHDRLFHSHRRDGQQAGRMVAWIGKRKDEA